MCQGRGMAEPSPDDKSTLISDVPAAEFASVVAGRYQLGPPLGSGGAGNVYEATVIGTDHRVAVKILRENAMAVPARVRREVAALRLLRLPGVVSLIDHGTWEGRKFLGMELLEGEQFPGVEPPIKWEQLAPLARSLLEALARVHAAGIVHRDLKPSNVLVGEDGRVTILDFGISYGPALGERVTQTGTLLGTPEYLAPEQICGDPADARSDLYAVGTMLYAALTGATPFASTNRMDIIRIKMRAPAPRLLHAAPDAPIHVADAVDAMLSTDREHRPRTAGEVLRRFFATDAAFVKDVLPRLGSSAPLDDTLAAVRAGQRVIVQGLPGTGRTRLLRDVAAELRAADVPVLWVAPGNSPYSGLRDVIDANVISCADSARDAHALATDALRARLSAGTVLLVDGPERVDRWSRQAIDQVRDAGAAIIVGEADADVTIELTRFSAVDLEPLFAGPRRILHLPDDAAHELWERTGGLARRVAEEVGAWCRAGLAHWESGRVHVTRPALDQLGVGGRLVSAAGTESMPRAAAEDDVLACTNLAWPHATLPVLSAATSQPRWLVEERVRELEEAGVVRRLADGRVQPLYGAAVPTHWTREQRHDVHRAIAENIPVGALARLRHFAAAHDPRAVPEAESVGERAYVDGKQHDGLVALEVGLSIAREHGDTEQTRRLLSIWVPMCLSGGAPQDAERGIYEIDRSGLPKSFTHGLRVLLQSQRKIVAGEMSAALGELDALAEVDDVRLEQWRHALLLRAARGIGIEEEERVISLAEEWAARIDDDTPGASIASWRAALAEKRGDPETSIAFYERALASTSRTSARIASHMRLSEALIDTDRIERAAEHATSARELSASVRHALYEAIAEALLRRIALRTRATTKTDDELLAALDTMGQRRLEAHVVLGEACIAWRAGTLRRARELAVRAHSLSNASNLKDEALIADALRRVTVSAADRDSEAAQRLVERLLDPEVDSPAVRFEALGILAQGFPSHAAEWRQLARETLEAAGPVAVRHRVDAMSIEEVLNGLG